MVPGSRSRTERVLEAGDELTEGSVNPHDILRIKGVRDVQNYMLREVQRVYRLQGVEISDKHIEVIVRQMLKKVRIEGKRRHGFPAGHHGERAWITRMSTSRWKRRASSPRRANRSFWVLPKPLWQRIPSCPRLPSRETTKVLTEAAFKGKVDHLIGLKENVLIGKLIPAGTGMKMLQQHPSGLGYAGGKKRQKKRQTSLKTQRAQKRMRSLNWMKIFLRSRRKNRKKIPMPLKRKNKTQGRLLQKCNGLLWQERRKG